MTDDLKHTALQWLGICTCVVALSQCTWRSQVAVQDRLAREAEAKASVTRALYEAQKASTETTASMVKSLPQNNTK